MEPVAISWLVASATSPLIAVLALWTVYVFHTYRRRWRTVDLFLLAVAAQELITAVFTFSFTIVSLINPPITAICSFIQWGLISTRTFQIATLTSMVVDRALTVRWPYRYRFSVRRNQIRYHIAVLAMVSILVGVAAVFARVFDRNSGLVCSGHPLGWDLRFVVFVLALYGALILISLTCTVQIEVHKCRHSGSYQEHGGPFQLPDCGTSEMPTATSVTSPLDTESHTGSTRALHRPYRHSSRRPYGKRVNGTSDFRWPPVAVVSLVCFSLNHLPYLVLTSLAAALPRVWSPWHEAILAWLRLIEGALVPFLLCAMDPHLRSALKRTFQRRSGALSPLVGDDGPFQMYFDKDHFRKRGTFGSVTPIGIITNYRRTPGKKRRGRKTKYKLPGLSSADSVIEKSCLAGSFLSTEPLSKLSCADLTSLEVWQEEEEENFYATLSDDFSSFSCNSVDDSVLNEDAKICEELYGGSFTTIANDDFEFHDTRPCGGEVRMRPSNFAIPNTNSFSSGSPGVVHLSGKNDKKDDSTKTVSLEKLNDLMNVTIQSDDDVKDPKIFQTPDFPADQDEDLQAEGQSDQSASTPRKPTSFSMNDLDLINNSGCRDEERVYVLPVKSESTLSLYRLHLDKAMEQLLPVTKSETNLNGDSGFGSGTQSFNPLWHGYPARKISDPLWNLRKPVSPTGHSSSRQYPCILHPRMKKIPWITAWKKLDENSEGGGLWKGLEAADPEIKCNSELPRLENDNFVLRPKEMFRWKDSVVYARGDNGFSKQTSSSPVQNPSNRSGASEANKVYGKLENTNSDFNKNIYDRRTGSIRNTYDIEGNVYVGIKENTCERTKCELGGMDERICERINDDISSTDDIYEKIGNGNLNTEEDIYSRIEDAADSARQSSSGRNPIVSLDMKNNVYSEHVSDNIGTWIKNDYSPNVGVYGKIDNGGAKQNNIGKTYTQRKVSTFKINGCQNVHPDNYENERNVAGVNYGKKENNIQNIRVDCISSCGPLEKASTQEKFDDEQFFNRIIQKLETGGIYSDELNANVQDVFDQNASPVYGRHDNAIYGLWEDVNLGRNEPTNIGRKDSNLQRKKSSCSDRKARADFDRTANIDIINFGRNENAVVERKESGNRGKKEIRDVKRKESGRKNKRENDEFDLKESGKKHRSSFGWREGAYPSKKDINSKRKDFSNGANIYGFKYSPRHEDELPVFTNHLKDLGRKESGRKQYTNWNNNLERTDSADKGNELGRTDISNRGNELGRTDIFNRGNELGRKDSGNRDNEICRRGNANRSNEVGRTDSANKGNEVGRKFNANKGNELVRKVNANKGNELVRKDIANRGSELIRTDSANRGNELGRTNSANRGNELGRTDSANRGNELGRTYSANRGSELDRTNSANKGVETGRTYSANKNNELLRIDSNSRSNELGRTNSANRGNELDKTESANRGNEVRRMGSANRGNELGRTESENRGNEVRRAGSASRGNEVGRTDSANRGNELGRADSANKGNKLGMADSTTKGNELGQIDSSYTGNELARKDRASRANDVRKKRTNRVSKLQRADSANRCSKLGRKDSVSRDTELGRIDNADRDNEFGRENGSTIGIDLDRKDSACEEKLDGNYGRRERLKRSSDLERKESSGRNDDLVRKESANRNNEVRRKDSASKNNEFGQRESTNEDKNDELEPKNSSNEFRRANRKIRRRESANSGTRETHRQIGRKNAFKEREEIGEFQPNENAHLSRKANDLNRNISTKLSSEHTNGYSEHSRLDNLVYGRRDNGNSAQNAEVFPFETFIMPYQQHITDPTTVDPKENCRQKKIAITDFL